MSNIKTRKGLAFGALVALGASLIAGAPAHAAGELNVVPSAGTLLSTLSTEIFTLKTNFTGSNATASTIADLRFQVKTNNSVYVESYNTTGGGSNTATATSATPADVAAANPGSANNALDISAVDTTKAATVEVTAYVDADNSNTFTAGEWNTVTTINLKTLASVAASINLDTPHADDTHVTGQVVLDGINTNQIQSGVSVDISTYDSTASVRTYSSIGGQNNLPATLKFDATVGALTAGDNIAARAQLDTAFNLDPEATSFALAVKKVVAHSVFHIAATVVNGANALVDGSGNAEVRANSP